MQSPSDTLPPLFATFLKIKRTIASIRSIDSVSMSFPKCSSANPPAPYQRSRSLYETRWRRCMSGTPGKWWLGTCILTPIAEITDQSHHIDSKQIRSSAPGDCASFGCCGNIPGPCYWPSEVHGWPRREWWKGEERAYIARLADSPECQQEGMSFTRNRLFKFVEAALRSCYQRIKEPMLAIVIGGKVSKRSSSTWVPSMNTVHWLSRLRILPQFRLRGRFTNLHGIPMLWKSCERRYNPCESSAWNKRQQSLAKWKATSSAAA